MIKDRVIKICDNLLEWCWLLIIFFVPILFSYGLYVYDRFGIIKVIFFITLTQLMLLIYVLKIFLVNKISYRVNHKIFIFIGILFLSGLISLFFSINPLRSWQGAYMRWQGLYQNIHYFLFFLLLILNFQPKANPSNTAGKQLGAEKIHPLIKRIIITILFSSALVCFYGLLQYVDLDFAYWQKSGFKTSRIFSSIGQPNFLGHYLILIIPLSLFSLFFIFKKNISKILVLILILIQIICLILTYSRAALLGFIAEICLLLLFYLLFNRKKIFNKKFYCKNYIIYLVILIIIFSLINIIVSQDNIKESKFIRRVKAITDIKGNLRPLIWKAGIAEIKQMNYRSLLFGYGQESQRQIYVKYYLPNWAIYEELNTFPDRSHNAVLDIILTTGFVGLFIILLFYYFIIKRLFQFIKKEKDIKNRWLAIVLLTTLIGYFINNLFSFSVIDTYIYLYLVLALIVYLIYKNNKERYISLVFLRDSFKTLIYFTLLVTIGIFIVLYNIKPVIADYFLMQAEIAKKINNDCQQIINNLNLAIKWNPYRTAYQNQYLNYGLNCLISQADGNKGIANLDIKNNIEEVVNLINSKDLDYKLKTNLANIFAVFGYYFDHSYYYQAKELYDQLININPYFTRVYKHIGRMMLWQKDYDLAIDYLIKGIKAVPDLDDPYLNKEHRTEIKEELIELYYYLGQAYNYKKEWAEAINYYDKALKLNPYNIQIYKNLADVYYQQDDLSKAIWYNKRGMMLDPKDYNWLFNIALLYEETGNSIKAKEYAELALDLQPDNKQVNKLIEDLKN